MLFPFKECEVITSITSEKLNIKFTLIYNNKDAGYVTSGMICLVLIIASHILTSFFYIWQVYTCCNEINFVFIALSNIQ